MTITSSEMQITFQTKELVLNYQDVKDLFTAQGILVDDANQVFSIILRKALLGGRNQDVLRGDLLPDQSLVFQFSESSGPTELA